ncbi:hypothetical protein BU17DRAFT_68930 [Hysterangium stoloniferum]|nr:hypothetical protein BU17DRAFT_68930 [Hysterangium stoloniferum]
MITGKSARAGQSCPVAGPSKTCVRTLTRKRAARQTRGPIQTPKGCGRRETTRGGSATAAGGDSKPAGVGAVGAGAGAGAGSAGEQGKQGERRGWWAAVTLDGHTTTHMGGWVYTCEPVSEVFRGGGKEGLEAAALGASEGRAGARTYSCWGFFWLVVGRIIRRLPERQVSSSGLANIASTRAMPPIAPKTVDRMTVLQTIDLGCWLLSHHLWETAHSHYVETREKQHEIILPTINKASAYAPGFRCYLKSLTEETSDIPGPGQLGGYERDPTACDRCNDHRRHTPATRKKLPTTK